MSCHAFAPRAGLQAAREPQAVVVVFGQNAAYPFTVAAYVENFRATSCGDYSWPVLAAEAKRIGFRITLQRLGTVHAPSVFYVARGPSWRAEELSDRAQGIVHGGRRMGKMRQSWAIKDGK